MKIKSLVFIILLIAAIGLSGCIEQQARESTVLPAPVINVKTFINERTGDPFMSGWEKKPAGWYNKYQGEPVSNYVDAMTSPASNREVIVVLVTEDRDPNLVLHYTDGRFPITQPGYGVMRSVPRGYPDGGKRVYQISMTFNLDNIESENAITIADDYYDVSGNSFIIFFDSKRTQGYY